MSKNWGLIKWGWRTRLVIGGVGLAIILVMYTSYQAGNATSANTSPSSTGSILPVRVITVRHLDGYESEHRYVGRIVSHRTGDIGFERVGRIAEIMVDEGSSVSISGATSEDLEGLALEFSWRQTGGPSVDLINMNSATASFTAPEYSAGTSSLSASAGNLG